MSFVIHFTGQFNYTDYSSGECSPLTTDFQIKILTSEIEDFTVIDEYTRDDITFSKIGDNVIISTVLNSNTQNQMYDSIIRVTALRTGNFKLENPHRTSNGITACDIRFYDVIHGTAGYEWFEIQPSPTPPETIDLGTFTKDQKFILQMRINTGTPTNFNEQIKFDMKMD